MEFSEEQATWLLSLCGSTYATVVTIKEGAQIVVVDPSVWDQLLRGARVVLESAKEFRTEVVPHA